MEWNEETISRLRSLWQEGHSTAEIGRRMSITKNAVVGKAHRLTLPPRPSPIRKGLSASPAASKPRGGEVARIAAGNRQAAAHLEQRRQAIAHQSGTQQSNLQEAGGKPAPAAPTRLVPESATVPPRPFTGLPAELRSNVTPLRRPPVAADMPDAPREPASETDHGYRSLGRAEPRRRGLSCCWPLGEPGTKQFRFCGGDPIPGKPYCTEHAQLAYVKLRDRRDTA